MKLKNLLLIALVAIVFCGCQSNYQPTSITVASYNLRNANGGDSINGNGWGQRYPVIAQIVQYHDFDIFGTQECFIHQLKDMKEALPGYDYIGVGRDDGKELSLIHISEPTRLGMISYAVFCLKKKKKIKKKKNQVFFDCM